MPVAILAVCDPTERLGSPTFLKCPQTFFVRALTWLQAFGRSSYRQQTATATEGFLRSRSGDHPISRVSGITSRQLTTSQSIKTVLTTLIPDYSHPWYFKTYGSPPNSQPRPLHGYLGTDPTLSQMQPSVTRWFPRISRGPRSMERCA